MLEKERSDGRAARWAEFQGKTCGSFLKAAVNSWDHHQHHTELLLGSQDGTGCLEEGYGILGLQFGVLRPGDLMESEHCPLSCQIFFPTSEDFCDEERKSSSKHPPQFYSVVWGKRRKKRRKEGERGRERKKVRKRERKREEGRERGRDPPEAEPSVGWS